MTDQANTETTENANSEATQTDAPTQDQVSDTSTTEKVDLSKPTEGDETQTDDKSKEGETDDKSKEGETEKGELFGAPGEGADYEITGLPEGMTIDAEMLGEVAPLLREMDISNEGASRLAQAYATGINKAVEGSRAQLETSIAAQRTEWENSTRAAIAGKDAEGKPIVLKNQAGETIGFDNLDVKGVQRVSAKALDRLAPEGFRDWLEETGLGLHPQMIAFAYNAGKAIAEDTVADETTSAPKALSREEKYYPKR